MDFPLNEDQESIDNEVRRVCADFSDDYWTDCEENSRFPHEFHRGMANGGWLGITMPLELGGAGLGVTEAFEASGGTGTVGLDGLMRDIPHLKQARNLIAQAGQSAEP